MTKLRKKTFRCKILLTNPETNNSRPIHLKRLYIIFFQKNKTKPFTISYIPVLIRIYDYESPVISMYSIRIFLFL
ncbi:MAG: hypothetical protein BGO42_15500 [Flavobacterium sp. 40-81]|nr:MAG: hypothetical protein ABS44_21175 [Chryseobacterium sp. SCN 40-13]OJV72827.1 MAG: hypothetical protein BGO42_15500 [Flavobacterium sp. 40-81]